MIFLFLLPDEPAQVVASSVDEDSIPSILLSSIEMTYHQSQNISLHARCNQIVMDVHNSLKFCRD